MVNQLLLVFRHLSELAAIALPYIFTSGAQPQSLILKMRTLFLIEMSTVQVVLSPIIIITFFGAREIAETQAGLCPP